MCQCDHLLGPNHQTNEMTTGYSYKASVSRLTETIGQSGMPIFRTRIRTTIFQLCFAFDFDDFVFCEMRAKLYSIIMIPLWFVVGCEQVEHLKIKVSFFSRPSTMSRDNDIFELQRLQKISLSVPNTLTQRANKSSHPCNSYSQYHRMAYSYPRYFEFFRFRHN